MIPTPEAVTRHLQSEIRRVAELVQRDGEERGPFSRLRRRWRRSWFAVRSDWIRSVLVVVLIVSTLAALALLVASWPPGGSDGPSQVVTAQGASLVFVVILVALLTPAVEAGRTIGWDVSWIRGDVFIWSALGVVAAISLFDLWLGSAGPDRQEELATILLTATGLALVGLAGRRAIALADPAVQLAERRRQESVRIEELLAVSSEQYQSAMLSTGVEPSIAEQISQIPSRKVQAVVRESVRRILATSRGAWHRGEWMLAAQAHAQAIVLALEYAETAEALEPEDLVFELLRNETDDLHEMADGPLGRWFSLTLLQNHIECALAVVAMGKSSMPHQGSDSLIYYFALDINRMVTRRLPDPKTPDVNAGVDGLKRLALAERRAGHAWGAASIAELGLEWAPVGVAGRMPQLAWPAWSCGMAVLHDLAYSADDCGGHEPWRSLANSFHDALRQVREAPSGRPSGFEPIVGYLVGDVTMVSLGYDLWRADAALLEEIRDFTMGVQYELVRLANTSDGRDRWANSKKGADVIYHLAVAAATRADQCEIGDSEREPAMDVVTSGPRALRNLMFDEDGVRDEVAMRDLLHIYLSAWQAALYLEDPTTDLSDPLVEEVQALANSLSRDVLADMPPDLARDGLRRLADWLDNHGSSTSASTIRSIAESVPEPRRGPFPGSTWGWGMAGGTYSVYRGSMIVPLLDRVDCHFRPVSS